jgi:hypothetical protein
MTYDEFSERLRKLKGAFKEKHGREMTSVAELEAELDRLLAKPKKKGARSLRGLSL